MPIPGPNFDPNEWRGLNERFYRMQPHAYLERRLFSLLLTVSDNTDTSDLWKSGVAYRNVKVFNDETTSRDDLDRYAVVESTALLHMACETLVRLYLAHEYRTPCPWTELAGLFRFAEFKRRVGALLTELEDPARTADVLEVFAYTSDHRRLANVTADQWDDHRKALVFILQAAANEILDSAHVYNAAKHGLALLADDVGFALGPEADPVIGNRGPALTFLERTAGSWQVTTEWTDAERNLGLTHLATTQIRQLWNVAAAYRVGRDPAPVSPLSSVDVKRVLDSGLHEGFNVERMSFHLRERETGNSSSAAP